jgi:hypothetical protein
VLVLRLVDQSGVGLRHDKIQNVSHFYVSMYIALMNVKKAAR